jgi:hypothetical protein
LSGAEFSFEDTALNVVEVLAAYAQDLGVAFDGSIVDDDYVHGLPPDPEWFVQLVFQAFAG